MNNKETIIYQLVERNNLIRYKDSKTKQPLPPTGKNSLRLMDIITDPETGQERYICYVKGEQSIYLDEQTNKDPQKKVPYLTFVGGTTMVDSREGNKVKFLDMSSKAEGSPSLRGRPMYRRVDRKKLAQNGMKTHSLITKARNLVETSPWAEVEAYAKVKGVKYTDPDEVRYFLSLNIKEDTAERFLTEFGSKAVRVKAHAIDAIEKGLVIVDEHSRNILWAETKQVFVSYAEGRIATDELANYFLRAEGERAYELVLSYLGVNKPKIDESAPSAEISKEDIEGMDLYDIVNLAIKEEVIKLGSDNSFRFKGSKIGGTEERVHAFFAEGKGVDKVDDLRLAVIDSFK